MRAVNICIETNVNIIKMSHESAHEWALRLADFYGQASEPARTPNVKVMCTSATAATTAHHHCQLSGGCRSEDRLLVAIGRN